MIRRAALLALLLPMACAPPPGPGETCPAPGLGALLGAPAAAAQAVDYAGPIRVIRPGMAITEDYSPARLNIDIDAAGRIARLWCG